MNFDVSDDQKMLKDQAHKFLTEQCTTKAVRNVFEGKDVNIETIPTDYPENIFSFFRVAGPKKVLVILNLSNRDRLQFRITHPLLEGIYTHLFSGINYRLDDVQSFELQAWEYVVLIC